MIFISIPFHCMNSKDDSLPFSFFAVYQFHVVGFYKEYSIFHCFKQSSRDFSSARINSAYQPGGLPLFIFGPCHFLVTISLYREALAYFVLRAGRKKQVGKIMN